MANNTQHRLVILGSLGEFVSLVEHAKERGIYTIVCDGYADGPAKKYADKSYNIDVREPEKIAQMCKEEGVDGIIGSFSDLLFEQITKVADLAGLRWYAKPDKLDFYREKDKAKALLTELGVRVPKNAQLSHDFVDCELDGYTFPLVIKPVNGYGSKGIYVVHSIEEIREHFDLVALRSSGEREKIQVEEYSYGREYNMMTWMVDGKVYPISIADREKNPQKGSALPTLNRVAYPAKAVAEVREEATAVLQKFADAVGQREGALSMQFFYNEHGVEVCEIAGRLFGYEHELVTHCCGLDIEKLLLDYVYDQDSVRQTMTNHSPLFQKHCSGLYFVGVQDKVIADQSVARELVKDPHVIESVLFYNEGETIDNYGPKPYLARYYIAADSREEIDEVTKYFFEHMHIASTDGGKVDVPFILEQD